MPTIESLLSPHLHAEAQLKRRLSELKEMTDQLRIELMGVQQRIQGIRDAAEVLRPAGEPNKRKRNTVKRTRSMSEHWQRILRRVGTGHPHFSYGELDEAAREIGRPLANDSLRSQMSDYKGRGWVEAVGLGSFRLTDAGRKAAGIEAEMKTGSDGTEPADGGVAERSNAADSKSAGGSAVQASPPEGSNPSTSAPSHRAWPSGNSTSPISPTPTKPWEAGRR